MDDKSSKATDKAVKQKDHEKPQLLGIDLGTSRTRVMSQRGTKKMVRSVVGFAQDLIGVKILGAPYVIGEEAFEKRCYLDLHYPLEDGVLKEFGERDKRIARDLIKHAVQLAEPGPDDQVWGVIGVPARATGANKALLLNMAHEVMDMALVISEPFMIAYGLGKLLNAIVIDIGAGTVDICALKGSMPGSEDQVMLTRAGNYIDERLLEGITESYPDVQINTHLACEIKEQYSYVGKKSGEIMVELRAWGKPGSYDVTEEIRMACQSIVPDIIENTEILLQRFTPEVQSVVLQNIILAGGGSRIKGLDKMIAAKLRDYGDVAVTCVKDPDFGGCEGALKLAQDLPPEHWGQLGETVGI